MKAISAFAGLAGGISLGAGLHAHDKAMVIGGIALIVAAACLWLAR